MLKKIMSLMISLMVVFGMVGCSTTEDSDSNVQGSSSENKEKSNDNNKNMDLELVNNDDLTMSIIKKYEKGDDYFKEIGYEVKIVNKTKDKDLLIGINDVSVDGEMNDPFWATTVTAGNKTTQKIYWWTGEEENETNHNVKSLKDLKNVEGTITISDDKNLDSMGEYKINIK